MKLQLARLDELRGQIDDHSLDTKQIINYFSEINTAALYTVNQLINETRDKEAAQQVHAIIYFLEAKEYASNERALGTYIFSTDNQSKNTAAEFAALISAQDAYIEAFLTISNENFADFYFHTMQGQDIEEVENLRSKLNSSGELDVDPTEWYRVITSKVNSLKRVEEHMLEHMHTYTENLASTAKWNFIIFILLDLLIGVITFTLVALIVLKLIKNVSILEVFALGVIDGNTSERVKIDTRDELGHYGLTFNHMLDKLITTQEELKGAKENAEYMYENIYKQSEVVFENVEQGIFLLDKDLKISNLYSKAVERIFDNEIIANENFCTFMRPRIIQRDYEALEMFMKHLFNPDMDEDVVNQLNPIEQVKTFISTNGVVITKHLRVSFTRIERAGVIHSILVTISDETESVMLQQHMEESEAKKKQDTEYLMNILKVEPNTLREFINDTKTTLSSISEKYEMSAKGNLNELLKYTFQTVHKVKGNAMSIGVELIGEKVHEIEESITKLMDVNVTPDKFLALLFELEEVDKMLSEMHRMLDKVGEIYKNFQVKQEISQEEKLTEELQKGLKTLSNNTEKEIELDLFIAPEIEVTEKLGKPIKDMVVQMMRNSISHGIEDSEERIIKGKTENGKISVSLDQLDYENISVTYEDDGRGLDLDKIKTQAVSKGLISVDESGNLSKDQILNLLFSDGFSTTLVADKLSGRGQGMSLIKSIITDLQGYFVIDFEKDRYFRMTIILPISTETKMEKVA
ncbi:MAG: nitrate- and nitrite sensing domain-containing protein [Bacteroidota bacterium]